MIVSAFQKAYGFNMLTHVLADGRLFGFGVGDWSMLLGEHD